jgi:DNA-binding MarR family transcriptional regulator
MPYDIESTFGFTVNRAAYVIRRAVEAAASSRGLGITPEEFAILALLWRNDGMRQGELAAITLRDRTTLTRMIDGMVHKGLVRRRHDVTDRRVIRTWLTSRGKRMEQTLAPMIDQLLKAGYDGIRRGDLNAAIETVSRVQDNYMTFVRSFE